MFALRVKNKTLNSWYENIALNFKANQDSAESFSADRCATAAELGVANNRVTFLYKD